MGQSQITTRTVKRFLIATVTTASVLACCATAFAADEPFTDVGGPELSVIYDIMMDSYFTAMAVTPVEELTTFDDHYMVWLIAYDDAFGVDSPDEGDLTMEEATDIFLDYYAD